MNDIRKSFLKAWMDGRGGYTINAFVGDATIYCRKCAENIYGRYTLLGVFDGSLIDRDGNPIGVLYDWQAVDGGRCGECGDPL